MRLEDKSLTFVVNFLLGVAWASVIIGVVSSFLSTYGDSFFTVIFATFIGAIPGLVAVLFIEIIITQKEKHLELKKQTLLLQKLLQREQEK